MAQSALEAALFCSGRMLALLSADWNQMLQGANVAEVPGFLLPWKLRSQVKSRSVTRVASASASASEALDLPSVLRRVRDVAGSHVGADQPLMEAGLDSLGAVELGNQLQDAAGVTLPSTLIIDFPTARQLSEYLLDLPAETHGPDPGLEEYSVPSYTSFGDGDDYISPCLVRLRGEAEGSPSTPVRGDAAAPEATGNTAPLLVIVHSVAGDEQGYERFYRRRKHHSWQDANAEVVATRHPGLSRRGDESSFDAHSLQHLIDQYAGELVAYAGGRTFNLIGASLGSIMAHRMAITCRNLGGRPERVILIDPPQPNPLPGFMGAMARNVRIGPRQAAESLMLGTSLSKSLSVEATMGAEDESAALGALYQEVQSAPEQMLSFLLAKASVPRFLELAGDDMERALFDASRRISTHRHLVQLLWNEWAGTAAKPPRPFKYTSRRGAPAIFLVRAEERGAFFGLMMAQGLRGVSDEFLEQAQGTGAQFGPGGLRAVLDKYNDYHEGGKMYRSNTYVALLEEDFGRIGALPLLHLRSVVNYDVSTMFGPLALELELPGHHFDVAARCISLRDPAFDVLAEQFFAPPSYTSAALMRGGAAAGGAGGGASDASDGGGGVGRASSWLDAAWDAASLLPIAAADWLNEQVLRAQLGSMSSLQKCLVQPAPAQELPEQWEGD